MIPAAEGLRYRLRTAADLEQLPPLAWLVRGVLPDAGLASIYGPSGSAKSFLGLDLAATVAEGTDWFGCRVSACHHVVYLCLEGAGGLCQRVRAWEVAKQRKMPTRIRFAMDPFNFQDSEDVVALISSLKSAGYKGGLLVIDTLNRAAGGADENSSRDMGQLIAGAKALQENLGGTVLLVHHTGKDSTKGMRGHSSLHAALDAAIEVTREGDRREWRVAKSKDGADGAVNPFRLRVVDLGEDDEGETITSCVIEPGLGSESTRRTSTPKGGNQRVCWDALGEILRESTNFGMGGAPATRPCVELEAAVDAIAPRLTCEAKRRPERTRQALTSLIAGGLIEHREGWLWVR